jgi:hypothetical protein
MSLLIPAGIGLEATVVSQLMVVLTWAQATPQI